MKFKFELEDGDSILHAMKILRKIKEAMDEGIDSWEEGLEDETKEALARHREDELAEGRIVYECPSCGACWHQEKEVCTCGRRGLMSKFRRMI
jgi:hypothetical protein